MLEVDALHAHYGKSHVLHGVELRVGAGEIVSLLGRNGVGRSTTLKAVMGHVKASGSVKFKGEELLGLKTHQIAMRGVGYVPEGRAIFPDLTVRENLLLGQKKHPRDTRWQLEQAFELFPSLREREGTPGGVLSGGEQQMLTLARTMMGNPELVLIDEPTEGLAPRVVEQVACFLLEVKRRGASVLLVEQKLAIALDISDRVLVMGQGRVVFAGTSQQLRDQEMVRQVWLGVAH
jgi:branched-chain amino acid transport system ATP-binding protein